METRGLEKASRQLSLSAELTHDEELADQLADLAREVERLPTAEVDPELIDSQLNALRSGSYTEVRAAIIRAQELLWQYSERTQIV